MIENPRVCENLAKAKKTCADFAEDAPTSPARAKKPLTKQDRIAKKRRELRRIYRDIDANKLKTVEALIERAAFYSVSLEDLEAELNVDGWTEEYTNGRNQSGVKRSAAADAHIAITKNLTAITKQLLELCPPAAKKSRLDKFLSE